MLLEGLFYFFFKKLLYFNLIFFYRIDFPADVIKSDSLLTNIIIDETTSHPENHCDDVFVYMTDTVSPGNFFFLIYNKTPKVILIILNL